MNDDTWQSRILEDQAEIDRILAGARRIAVLGIRSDRVAHRPAHYVPAYLHEAGLDVIPVPVYEQEVVEILGRPVYRRIGDIPGVIDIVDVFRRPEDIPPHLEDILGKRPGAVWFQTGIRHDPSAERLAREGIWVVQDRCLMVEHRRWAASQRRAR
ncbi:MAG: CoA-binding protein [Anaerolineales bacterium]